jgi:hypothetical protein
MINTEMRRPRDNPKVSKAIGDGVVLMGAKFYEEKFEITLFKLLTFKVTMTLLLFRNSKNVSSKNVSSISPHETHGCLSELLIKGTFLFLISPMISQCPL